MAVPKLAEILSENQKKLFNVSCDVTFPKMTGEYSIKDIDVWMTNINRCFISGPALAPASTLSSTAKISDTFEEIGGKKISRRADLRTQNACWLLEINMIV